MKKRREFIKSASLIVAGAAAAGYQVSYAKNSIVSIDKKTKKSMLQHNVFFYLNEGVSESEKKGFEKGMKDFVSAVKEIQKAEFGIPASTEDRDVVDHSFGYALFVRFKSMDDHNLYQKHPAHKTFINSFSSLWKEVKVFDVELM